MLHLDDHHFQRSFSLKQLSQSKPHLCGASFGRRKKSIYQRTNGPVNAHLISGPTVSTKTNKIGQPMVIIYINIVELESPMLHAKFTSGSGEDF